ncbi:T9SS type A sorting domain-containing protein [Bacteroidales bacterium OttesenSCG-928-B11]|nr:T9SS type A sorting domain-containing protein [Bacteroidales bacterium OttesenSCG-928-E04]MDL2308812.1 T9SS type A sorting domain-containing protein [Bacteroidales bacterium OttesenSCG-928-C03]MDL2312892.1 T9SS type A sorting domain-containing protein [Bacteroidales bacterium OttesenSCG-928-B11]MDL2325700.1 T9SS type A sorting domain-containing protein [Bacteroidales bacterium OttesenSCG-928-A14]
MPKISQGQECPDCLWLENTALTSDNFEYTTLTKPYVNPETAVGNTDRYRIVFGNKCSLPAETKVSLEWRIYHDGVLLTENLDKFANVYLQTEYARANMLLELPLGKYGECAYLKPNPNEGGKEFTTYPGAITVFNGINIEKYGLDFFYLHFFQATTNYLEIEWKQIGNYRIELALVERVGQMGDLYQGEGTDDPSFYYDGEQKLSIGGHQTDRGRVLAEVVFEELHRTSKYQEICGEDANFVYGRPEITFTAKDTVYDLPVPFYHPLCNERMDSVVDLELVVFPILNTPIAVNDTICEGDDDLTLADLPTQTSRIDFPIVIEWLVDGKWDTIPPVISATGRYGTDTIYIRHAVYGEEIHCAGDSAMKLVVINPAPLRVFPTGADTVQYCISTNPEIVGEPLDETLDIEKIVGTTIYWLNGDEWTTEAPTPAIDVAGDTIYYVRRMHDVTECFSLPMDTVRVYVYDLPVVEIEINQDPICEKDTIVLTGHGADTYVWTIGEGVNEVELTGTTVKLVADSTIKVSVVGKKNNFRDHFCTNTADTTVTVFKLPVIEMNTIACNGQGFQFDPKVPEGVNFTWDGGYATKFDSTFVNLTDTAIFERFAFTATQDNDGLVCTLKDTFEIRVGVVPELVITGNDTVCAETFFAMSVSDTFHYATGTPEGYIYEWFDETEEYVSERFKIDVAGDTTIWVNVTNIYDCTAKAEKNIHVLPAPDSGIAVDLENDTTCQDYEVLFTAQGNYEFEWRNGEELISTESSMTYKMEQSGDITITLLARDSITECEKTFTKTIFVHTRPEGEIEAERTQACLYDSLTLAVAGNNADYTYEWYISEDLTLEGNPVTFSVDTTGDVVYRVKVTNEVTGCTTMLEQAIHVDTLPAISFATDPDPISPVCNNTDITITAVASDNPNEMFYEWISPKYHEGQSMTTTVFNTDTKPDTLTYHVKVTNRGTRCVNTDSIKVEVMPIVRPVITVDKSEICADDFATLGLTKEYAKYRWSTGDTTETIQVNLTGNYGVTVYDIANCEGIATEVAITVFDLPVIEQIVIREETVCPLTPVGMKVSAASEADPIAYEWTFGSMIVTVDTITIPEEAIINNSGAPIDYFVNLTITDANGCTTDSAVKFVVDPLPHPVIVVNQLDTTRNDFKICLGDSIELKAVDHNIYVEDVLNTNFQWGHIPGDPGHDSIIVVKPEVTTTYSLYAINYYGCSYSTERTIVVLPKTDVKIIAGTSENDTTVCPGETVRLEALPTGLRYDWGDGKGFVSTSYLDVTVTESGKYVVKADDVNSCVVESDTFYVNMRDSIDVKLEGDDIHCGLTGYTLTFDRNNWFNELEITWPGDSVTLITDERTWTTDFPDFGDHTFTIQVRDTVTGCVQSFAKTVSVKDFIAPSLTISTDAQEACDGQEVIFYTITDEKLEYEWKHNNQTVGDNDTLKFAFVGGREGRYEHVTLTATDTNGCSTTITDSIFVHPAAYIEIIRNEDDKFCAENLFEFEVRYSEGIKKANIAWSVNGVEEFVGDSIFSYTLKAGKDTVSVIATVAFGDLTCRAVTDTFEIEISAGPEYETNTESPLIVCAGLDTVLRITNLGDDDYTYEWSNGDEDSYLAVNVTKDTTVTVTITDEAGCPKTETFDIKVQFVVDTIIVPENLCLNGEGYVIVDAHTVTDDVIYLWNEVPGTNEYLFTSTVAGANTLNLVIRDTVTLCEATRDITINVKDAPASSIEALEIQIACDGDSINLYAPGEYVSYEWKLGTETISTERNPRILPETTKPGELDTVYYSLTLSDGECSNTVKAPVEIRPTPPAEIVLMDSTSSAILGEEVALMSGDTVCANYLLKLIANPDETAPYQYYWDGSAVNSAVLLDSVKNDTQEIILKTYSLEVRNAATGCKTIITDSVYVRPDANASIFASSLFECAGVMIGLSVDNWANYDEYLWDNGKTTPTRYVDVDGNYSVKVRDLNGCYSTATFDEKLTFIETNLEAVAVPTTICGGGKVAFSATTADDVTSTIAWTHNDDLLHTGDSFDKVLPNADTVYTYMVVAESVYDYSVSLTCRVKDTVYVTVNPAPVAFVDGVIADTLAVCANQFPVVFTGNDNAQYADLTKNLNNTVWGYAGVVASMGTADTVVPSISFTLPDPVANHAAYLKITNDYGCTDSLAFTVKIVDSVKLVVATTNYTNGTTLDSVCVGDDIELRILTTGEGWTWNGEPGNATRIIRNIQRDTTFVVASTSTSNCFGTGTITIQVRPLPTIPELALNPAICTYDSKEYIITPATDVAYSWVNIANDNVVAVGAVAHLKVGNYVLVAVDTASSLRCEAISDTIKVAGKSTPVIDSVSVKSDGITLKAPFYLCEASTYGLTANLKNYRDIKYTFEVDPDFAVDTTDNTINGFVMPATKVGFKITATDTISRCVVSVTDTINVNLLPVVDQSAKKFIACELAEETEIFFTPATAGDKYTYTWTPAALSTNGDTATVKLSGDTAQEVFYATITTEAGCSIVDSITVTKRYVTWVSQMERKDSICLGETVKLVYDLHDIEDGGANITSSEDPSLSYVPKAPGEVIYVVSVYNVDDVVVCATDTFKVQVLPLPEFTLKADTICAGEDIVIYAIGDSARNATITGFTDITPVISNDTATFTLPGYAAGDHKFFITMMGEYGCDRTDSITVRVNAIPEVTYDKYVTGTPGNTACQFENVTITASGADYTYNWGAYAEDTDNSITFVFGAPAVDTLVVVTVTNEHGCSIKDTLHFDVLAAPVDNIKIDGDRCETMILSSSNNTDYDYEWQYVDAAGVDLIGTAGVVLSNDSLFITNVDGTAILTVTETTSGYDCQNWDTTEVLTFFVEPTIDITAVGTDITIDEITNDVDSVFTYDIIVRDVCGILLDSAVSINFKIKKDGVVIDQVGFAKAMQTQGLIQNNSAITYFVHAKSAEEGYIGDADGIAYWDVNATGNIPYGEDAVSASRSFQIETGESQTFSFDWFYLHFLVDRRITVSFNTFKEPGLYEIEYELVKHVDGKGTNKLNPYPYTYESGNKRFGGIRGIQDRVLATRTITLNVEGVVAPAPPVEEPVAPIVRKANVKAEMAAYPNPVNANKVTLRVSNVEAGQATITINDINGNMLETFKANIEDADVTTITHYLQANYANGSYVVVLRKGKELVTTKIMIQK